MSNLILELTDKNFNEAVSQETPILVDFWAPWCGPCRAFTPILEEVAENSAGRLRVGKLNVDDHPQVAARYEIMSIPTLLLMQKGNIITRLVGATSKSALTASLNQALGEPAKV